MSGGVPAMKSLLIGFAIGVLGACVILLAAFMVAAFVELVEAIRRLIR